MPKASKMNSSSPSLRGIHPVARYLAALVAIALAVAARWALTPMWGPTQLPYTFFFLAAILVAWWARLGPALLTIVAGVLLGNWFFVQPRGVVPTGAEAMRVAAFLASSLAAILAIEAIHRANARAQTELVERRRSEQALAEAARRQETLYRFTDRIQRAKTLEAIYDGALDAILAALGCDRASILLFDESGVMRFVGWRGLSSAYRRGVEGHSPWTPDVGDPVPIGIEDVRTAEMDEGLRTTVQEEGLGALAFVPLVADNRLIGKFMAYCDAPHVWTEDELDLAMVIARQLAFGIARKRGEHALRDSEQRLEQAMAAGRMGAWEWNIRTGRVIWSPGLERIHGLEPGTFGGTLPDFQQDLHPEDRDGVMAGIQQVAREGGDYHVSYRIRRPDGMERWVEAFGRVSSSSKGEPERLSGVCMDITARRHDETERERLLDREHQMRQAAEEGNRVKDEFLATLSHELRNPLNAILGYSELLLRTCEAEELRSLRPIGEALKRNSLIQSNLIRDLLDLSKLRSGKVQMNVETFDLLEAARNAAQTIRAEATAKNVAMHIEVPKERLYARADLLRFGQVAWNLLNNAVKFTPSGGSISIGLRQEGDEVLMTVEDTGQGIDTAFLPHIFEMFRQADPSTTRAHAGMGIGLALVRQLVELQGGSVSAHSDGAGHGARFVVRLPAGREADLPASSAPPQVLGTLTDMRVLVVDDSEDTTDMLQRLLESYGATVATAHSGADALLLAAEQSWSVILSDISMPGMDGFEFLRRLRSLQGRESVPVLALTGYGQAEDVRRAEAAGFVSHMTKPVDLEVLTGFLRDLRSRGVEVERSAPADASIHPV
jgi:PAS domain S-box-containing protein